MYGRADELSIIVYLVLLWQSINTRASKIEDIRASQRFRSFLMFWPFKIQSNRYFGSSDGRFEESHVRCMWKVDFWRIHSSSWKTETSFLFHLQHLQRNHWIFRIFRIWIQFDMLKVRTTSVLLCKMQQTHLWKVFKRFWKEIAPVLLGSFRGRYFRISFLIR